MKHKILIAICLAIVCLCGCGKQPSEETVSPVPTKIPTATPGLGETGVNDWPSYIRIDGVLFSIDRAFASEMEVMEECFLGTTTEKVDMFYPEEDFTSNVLPAGTLIYADAEDENKLYLQVLNEISGTYYNYIAINEEVLLQEAGYDN